MKAWWANSASPDDAEVAAVSRIRKSSLIAEHCPVYRTLECGPTSGPVSQML